jgi:hypothetical protein
MKHIKPVLGLFLFFGAFMSGCDTSGTAESFGYNIWTIFSFLLGLYLFISGVKANRQSDNDNK